MYLPIGLFGVSIATASLPDIARHATAADLPAIRRAVSGALRMMLMLNVPATVGLMVLAEPIVALLLEHGRFNPADTHATAAALMFYAPGLLGYSAVKIASPTFYSLRDSRTPVIVSVLSVLVNLAINLALVRVMGYRGLALGTALAAMFNAVALLWLLRGRLGGLEGRRIATSLLKIVIASIVMGLAAWCTSAWLTRAIPGDALLWKAVRVTAAIGAGVVALVDLGAPASHRRIRGGPETRPAPAQAVVMKARAATPVRAPPDHPADGQRPHDGGRLRQHLRAAAAAADPATRSHAGRGRDADDALSARGVGGADRVRASGGPMAAARCS